MQSISASTWRVTLLGEVRLTCGDRQMTRFESRKVVALLARLVLHPNRWQTREELAVLLWPDAERRVGLERLRHVLSSLQRQIALPGDTYSPPLFVADRLGVRLQAGVLSDVGEFEARIRRKRWKEAALLYTGDLLPGHYDDWIQDERERLQAVYESALDHSGDGEPDDDPPPLPLSPEPLSDTTRRVFLPPYLTTFFGREEELVRLGELLQERRLVTLLGPGGCGKTRLAVEVCRGAAGAFRTVLFVSLTDCHAPEQVPDRIRAALQLPPGASPLEQVCIALQETSTLIVLDNMEQMEAEAAAGIIAALLERLPQMHCLLTSRTLLHMAGEQVFPLQPLPLPELAEEAEPGETAPLQRQNPCLRLFVDRARMSRPDFAVTSGNRDDLFALCRVLEGLPLALELCASRIRVHSPGEMRRQVESGKRFTLVARADGAQRKSGRHGSLRAAIRWSWNLLPARLQDTLAALSLLHGRFRAETVSALCGIADSRPLLEELADASLLQMQIESLPEGEVTFFFLLESVREFASEHLQPARRQALRHAHTAFLLALAANPLTASAMAWEDTLYLRGAVEEAISDGEGSEALTLCTSLREFWYSTGGTRTALDLLQRALALPPDPESSRVRTEALAFGVYLAVNLADFALASRFARQAESEAGDSAETLAVSQAALAFLRYRVNEPSAAIRSTAEAGLIHARRSDRRDLVASLETTLGMLENREKKFAEAEGHLQAAEALWQSLGDEQRASLVRFKRAVIASDQGDISRARHCYEECLVTARRVNDQKTEASIYGNLGLLLTQEGRWSEAVRAIQEGIRRSYRLGNVLSVHIGLWNLAEPLALLSRGAEAVTAFSAGRTFWEAGGVPLTDEDIVHRDFIFAKASESLPGGASDFARHDARGRGFSLREAVDFALRL